MAAQAGDREAFGALLDGQIQVAYRLAQVVTGSPATAEDAVQEACIRAWRDLPKLRDPERWPQWYRRIATRAAVDVARAEGRQRHADLVDDVRSDPQLEADAVRRDEVRRALRQMDPRDRMLVALRYAADLEVPDVADALGIPLGTAKSRLHRVLARLRVEMGPDE